MKQNILAFFLTIWILQSGLDLGEDPEVIQPLLALGDPALRNWIAGSERNPARDQRRIGGFQAPHQSPSYKLALSRNHTVAKVHSVGRGSRILAVLKLSVRITVVVVVTQNRVAIHRDIGGAVRLPFRGPHDGSQILFV